MPVSLQAKSAGRRSKQPEFSGEKPHDREFQEEFRPVRGPVQFTGQISPSGVPRLVPSPPPEGAGGDIIDQPPVCDVCRGPVSPIAGAKLLKRELPVHRQETARRPIRAYFRNLDTNGEVSPLRRK